MKTAKFIELFINFLIGGIGVVGASILGNFLSPLAGAIFWAYPNNLLPSLFFMRQNKKDDLYLAKFLESITFGSLLLGTTTFAMSHFIRNSPEGSSLWLSIGKATLVYLVCVLILYLVIRLGGFYSLFE
jgi:hypothetical protein